MEVSPDYEELFRLLNDYKVRYLVVGAYAVMFYSAPRFTKDLDLWISPDGNDPNQVHKALREFGAPLKGIRPEDFRDKTMILQIGVAPVRVDIMMDVPGVAFHKAWKNKKKGKYGKTPIHVLGISELIQAKKTSGRAQDQLDLKQLQDRAEPNRRMGKKRSQKR